MMRISRRAGKGREMRTAAIFGLVFSIVVGFAVSDAAIAQARKAPASKSIRKPPAAVPPEPPPLTDLQLPPGVRADDIRWWGSARLDGIYVHGQLYGHMGGFGPQSRIVDDLVIYQINLDSRSLWGAAKFTWVDGKSDSPRWTDSEKCKGFVEGLEALRAVQPRIDSPNGPVSNISFLDRPQLSGEVTLNLPFKFPTPEAASRLGGGRMLLTGLHVKSVGADWLFAFRERLSGCWGPATAQYPRKL